MIFFVKLLAGILVGSLLGLYAPEFIARIALNMRDAFGQFLVFVIPFLILIFAVNGIADLNKNSDKSLAIKPMSLVGLFVFVVVTLFLPDNIDYQYFAAETFKLSPLINISIEPLMSVLTALLIGLMFGLGIANTQSNNLKLILSEAKSIIDLITIKIIIPLLPLYIATIFCVFVYDGTVINILLMLGGVVVLMVYTVLL